MSKFRVTYPSGAIEEVAQSDCHTIEQFANTKFGYADYAAHGVTVELVEHGDDVWLAAADAAKLEGMASDDDVSELVPVSAEPIKPAKKKK